MPLQKTQQGWHKLWIECDSKLVVAAFKSIKLVPWHIRNRWRDGLTYISKMQFQVSHIFREANTSADKLAS